MAINNLRDYLDDFNSEELKLQDCDYKAKYLDLLTDINTVTRALFHNETSDPAVVLLAYTQVLAHLEAR